MTKLFITTLVLTFAIASAATAASSTTRTNTTTKSSTTATTGAPATVTTAQAAELESTQPAAGKKAKNKRKHRKHAKPVPVAERGETTPYTEMRVGDPRIVYHEIGTSGAQDGNTIVPFHDEPIRSSKPYEIRYDYAEFRDGEAR